MEEEEPEQEPIPKVFDSPVPPPYPQRLRKPKKDDKTQEFLELFKQVKINIPVLDMIRQVPSYAKYLKDLCTVKRRVGVPKQAFLTDQVSSIIMQNMPHKYKDPGCPTITCIIGNHTLKHDLLDLGSSVNLLPFSVYQ